MHFIEVIDGYDLHDGYVVSSLDKAKEVMLKITKELSGPNVDYDDPSGWISIDDEIKGSASFEDLESLVYEFADTTGVVFRFSTIEEAEAIELME